MSAEYPPKRSKKINWFVVLVSAISVFLINSFINNDNNSWSDKKAEVTDSLESQKSSENEKSSIEWVPKNFEIWSGDSNIAWRWLGPNEFSCKYGDACWGMMIVTKNGCSSNLYAELSLLDKAGIQVGYTNETMSSALPLQKSKLIFETFEETAESARVAKISCY